VVKIWKLMASPERWSCKLAEMILREEESLVSLEKKWGKGLSLYF
jgi:hypothetical protein